MLSVNESDMFEGDSKPENCTVCGRTMDKWIEYIPLGDFCPSCAQHIIRCLLEDLIEYHNGTHISLLKIMYHGDTTYPERKDRKSVV
jgi:hypothetical protein